MSLGLAFEVSLYFICHMPYAICHISYEIWHMAYAPSHRTLCLFRDLFQIEKRQLLHLDVALLRQADRRRSLADKPLVGQILASRGHALYVKVALEMILDLAAGTRFADITQMFDHQSEELRRALSHVAINSVERRLHVLPRLFGVEQVGVNRFEQRRGEVHRLRNHL